MTPAASLAAVAPEGEPLGERGEQAAARLRALFDADTMRPLRAGVDDGVIAGSGLVDGRPVLAWAQDGTVRGGSLGVRGGETIAVAIRRADERGVPVVGFPHSGGARLQEGTGALTAYAAIFREQALARVPQLSVVCGPCAGGAAYSPALGDVTIMTARHARMFLTGPAIVEQVMRERVSAHELGGARVHDRNGVAHMIAADEREAIALARTTLAHLPPHEGAEAPRAPAADPLAGDPGAVLPPRRSQVYDVRDVTARILDAGELLELAPRWGANLVVGLARLDGSPVGLIASQPRHLGGVLDATASEKGARFVQLCDRFGLPLVVLVDTPGFLPGRRQEAAGVIRHGAALLRAFGRARVPRVTVTLRQAYGGAHIVMNSRDLGADHTLAWRGAHIGVMGARQAVGLINRREIEGGADERRLARRYEEEHLPARRAAADGYVDEVIDPAQTRDRIAAALHVRARPRTVVR